MIDSLITKNNQNVQRAQTEDKIFYPFTAIRIEKGAQFVIKQNDEQDRVCTLWYSSWFFSEEYIMKSLIKSNNYTNIDEFCNLQTFMARLKLNFKNEKNMLKLLIILSKIIYLKDSWKTKAPLM